MPIVTKYYQSSTSCDHLGGVSSPQKLQLLVALLQAICISEILLSRGNNSLRSQGGGSMCKQVVVEWPWRCELEW